MLDKLMSLPANLSAHGPIVDHMMVALHWFMLALFVGWSCFFLFCLWRFRRGRNPKADYHGVRNHFSTHAEIGVIIVEVFLLLGFAFPFWAKRVNQFPNPAEAVTVRAQGKQFGWSFHHPGADGVFGKRDVNLVSGGNPHGLDFNDPNAKDDFFEDTILHVPVNKPIIIQLTSQDVIHNFALREMRIAQDAIPGSEIPMWFTPVETGEFEVICGQLCGRGHYSMKATLLVETEEEFKAYLASKVQTP